MQGEVTVSAALNGVTGSATLTVTPPGPLLSLLAGKVVVATIDGPVAVARLNVPVGIATDAAGNVFVADAGDSTIRKITPSGIVATLAGSPGATGSSNGTGATARFKFVSDFSRFGPGLATDEVGNLYVTDTGNNTLRTVTPVGLVTTMAGTAGVQGSADGVGVAAQFSFPSGVTTDGTRNVYLTDTLTGNIRKITPAGAVTTLASAAPPGGTLFDFPTDVATDAAGNVYVANTCDSVISKITPTSVVTTLAGTLANVCPADGPAPSNTPFVWPAHVATDAAGHLYVADSATGIVFKSTPAGIVTTLASGFSGPMGVATDHAGNVYVTDRNSVAAITPTGVVKWLVAQGAPSDGSADGVGANASFYFPEGLTSDGNGNLFVADHYNDTIRKVTPAGVVTTLAGTAGAGGSADGTGASANFSLPTAVASDVAGNVYVADSDNYTIRKITPAGVVTTLAGNPGVPGNSDGSGVAATFWNPSGVATDALGNVYVADAAINCTIRKITPAGLVTTFAGTASVPGVNHCRTADGTGASAQFSSPGAITTDNAGNLYVADGQTIRKITPAAVVTTLAGAPLAPITCADGIGVGANFGLATGVTTDAAGDVYVADNQCYTIRKITPSGVVTTIAGSAGLGGFAPGPLPGMVSPWGVVLVGTTLYVTTSNAIAQVTRAP
jgi:hypothetical protein